MMEKFESQKKNSSCKKNAEHYLLHFLLFHKNSKKKKGKKNPQKILTSFVRDKYLIDNT